MFDGVRLPRIIVELALAINPGFDASVSPYLTLGSPFTPIGTGILAPESQWTDISDDLRSLSIRRGRARELDDVEPGSMVIGLDNDHGYYDPSNTASPYYAVDDSNIRPMLQVRCRAEWAGTTYFLFYGHASGFSFDMGSDPSCSITVTDPLAVLAQANLTEIEPAFSNERTDVRIGRVLDLVDWPATMRALDTGKTFMPATTLGENALAVAQKANVAENGLLFADPKGNVTFYNRHRVYTNTRSTVPQTVLSDDVAGPDESEYFNLQVEYGVDSVANDIHVKRDGSENEQVATDAESVNRYGLRDLAGSSDLKALQVQTDAEALDFARYLLGRYKKPDLRVTAVEVDVAAQPVVASEILGLDFLDRITVERNYYGTVVPRDLLIQGVSIDIDPGTFRFSFNTVSAERAVGAFIVGTSALDSGQLAY